MQKNIGIETLGESFASLNNLISPDEKLNALVDRVGELFRCERVYIFEKNREGTYDCTNEWVVETALPKKHLLQGIPAQGLKYYYHYFKQGKPLAFEDIEDLRRQDETLYSILRPQGLKSLISMPLVIDGKDIGFIGMDNPPPEKYAELLNIAAIISRFISIHVHQRKLESTIKESVQIPEPPVPSEQRHNLPSRILEIQEGRQVAVIYFEVTLRNHFITKDRLLVRRMLTHTEEILSGVFGYRNVFRIEDCGFIAIFEDSKDLDISRLDDYIASVNRTMGVIDIFSFAGASSVSKYTYIADFFDMVYQANGRMLYQKKKYRDFYTEKYHMDNYANQFRELVEVHPESDSYQVLYSEYQKINIKTGAFSSLWEKLKGIVHKEDLARCEEFWTSQLALSKEHDRLREDPQTNQLNFRVKENGKVLRLKLAVAIYLGKDGSPTMLCYTQ